MLLMIIAIGVRVIWLVAIVLSVRILAVLVITVAPIFLVFTTVALCCGSPRWRLAIVILRLGCAVRPRLAVSHCGHE